MKTAADRRNLGRATPEAAIETQLWAANSGDLDVYTRSYAFDEATKQIIDPLFAALSEPIRARYGSAERLFASIWLAGSQAHLPQAIQVVSEKEDGANRVIVQTWQRDSTGREQLGGAKLTRNGNEWIIPVQRFPESYWKDSVARVDPITGAVMPPK